MTAFRSDKKSAARADAPEDSAKRRAAGLTLAALGVVYGDIGTSPLYAMHQCFASGIGLHAVPANVLGILSLIFWALVFVISVKYQGFVMRADNHGEGGILALLASLDPWRNSGRKAFFAIIVLGVFGASLLYGDGVITPAISVLSAVEGLGVAAPAMNAYVLPVAIGIIVALFCVQHKGTGSVGGVFGPVMLVWFAALGLLGALSIVHNPAVFRAVDPAYGVRFLLDHGRIGLLVMGAVFLTVTGGETLYADMGHFGRGPIATGWFFLVLPCLLLNYFGQGALLLAHPDTAAHPFYSLAPHWALYPMIGLATMASVIASQAVISGAFSLIRQAAQLGQSPRVRVIQTSDEEMGQIYVPTLNWMLMCATVAVVLLFRSSDALAAAYGIAISITMVITTVLLAVAIRRRWGWPLAATAAVTAAFLCVDLPFLAANMMKIAQGGWLPISGGLAVFTVMMVWSSGRRNLWRAMKRECPPIRDFVASVVDGDIRRVPGTAVFLTPPKQGTPPAARRMIRYTGTLHERVFFVTVLTEDRPRLGNNERLEVLPLGNGFYRVFVRYGFMQQPNLALALGRLRQFGLPFQIAETSFFISSETLMVDEKVALAKRWRNRLYAFMRRNAEKATRYYRIPPRLAVEIGVWYRVGASADAAAACPDSGADLAVREAV